MKQFKYIVMLMMTMFLFSACEMEIEHVKVDPAQSVAPTLLGQKDIIVNQDNSKVEAVVFNWTSASFGVPTQIQYALYLTLGENSVLAGTSFSNSFTISKQDLNGLVCNDLKVKPNETANISAGLVASIYGTNVAPVKSNNISFNITTFAADLRYLFLPGNYQSWNITQAPQFWETDGGTNLYKILVDLQDGSADYSYFKVTVARNWSDENWGYNYLTPSWNCPEQSDSNLSVDLREGSIYELTVNRSAMTIDKTVVDGVGMCGAYNGWSYATTGDDPLTYDATENVWVSPEVTFTDDGGLAFLIRLNTANDPNNWAFKFGTNGETSAEVPGGIKLVQGGGDITVPSAGTYIIKLHGNRTPYVLVMEKQ